MPIIVTVRTVGGASGTVQVEPTITIGELKKVITEQCGLGIASTLVFKGAPLKNEAATLEDVKYQPTDSIVCVFKKAPAAAPAATPATAAPATTAPPVAAPSSIASSTSSSATPAKQAQPTPTVAPTAPVKAKPVEEKPPQVEWSCPACTYINIPARTICEICGTEDPAKAKGKKKSPQQAARDAIVVPKEAIEEQLKAMGGDNMDEESKNAVRAMIEDDIRDAMLANDGKFDASLLGGDAMGDDLEDIAIDIEDLLKKAESDEEVKKALLKEFNLAEDASIDDLRQAINTAAHQQEEEDEDGMNDAINIQTMLNDPALGPQLQQLLQNYQGDEQGLQGALMQLIGQGLMMGDEDDEDVEYDDEMGDL